MNLLEHALTYAGRGWAIVPVKFDRCKKQGAVRWKRYQNRAPDTQRLRRWFADGKYPALAVILGEVSGHLVCRDFDDTDAYERWAGCFPELAHKLPTVRTDRGYHVYFKARLEKTVQYTDGELRGPRSMCILPPSRHPSGKVYRWCVPLPERDLPAVDPEEAALTGEPVTQKRTEENRCRLKQTDSNRGKLRAGEGEDELELAIAGTLPTGPGHRNRQVFHFARALKGISSLADKDAQSLRGVVQEWHARALPQITTKEFEETWIDFLWAWPRVHTPMRLNLMEDAMNAARANPVPHLTYQSEGVRDLVALCRELQGVVGDGPFFLSTRTAGRLLGVGNHTAWRWLFLLEQDGWIVTVEKGGTPSKPYRATRFRYTANSRRNQEEDGQGTRG